MQVTQATAEAKVTAVPLEFSQQIDCAVVLLKSLIPVREIAESFPEESITLDTIDGGTVTVRRNTIFVADGLGRTVSVYFD